MEKYCTTWRFAGQKGQIAPPGSQEQRPDHLYQTANRTAWQERAWYRLTAIALIAATLAVVTPNSTVTLQAAQSKSNQTTHSTVDDRLEIQDKNERQIQVMVELDMPPVAQIYSAEAIGAASADQIAAATKAHLASVEASQLSLLSALEQLDAEAIFRVQRVYNGIAVSIAQEQLDALRSMPGVANVHELTPVVPTHTSSVPFVHAPDIWAGMGGAPAKGKGMTIAIVDTGIDYLHANFNGTGDYADNDPEVIGDVAGFPGAKVVAGYDFAGDAYNADPESQNYSPFPRPDPDPMDCYGHGTHVAGTAAGTGVSADFTPVGYDGPFDQATFSQVFRIGPGMAPAAQLVALKVFGCQGSSNLTVRAIEWAVDPDQDGDFSDHVDVINMSLGSRYGSLTDPTVIASDNAAQIGVIVVASAGNEGDVYYVTGSPAVSTRAISVAAVSDHQSTGVLGFAASFTSRGPRLGDAGLKPDISAPGTNIRSARSGAPGIDARQLSGTSMAAPHVAGAMALLREIHPDWRVEELKALVMNTARLQSPAPTTVDEQRYAFGPSRIGSGILDLANALNTEVIAYNGDDRGAVGISFGAPEVVDSRAAVKNLRILNRAKDAVSYLLTVHTTVDTPGVSFSLDQDRVKIPARGSASIPILMFATADEMRHTRAPNVSDTQSLPRHWLSEESGDIILWPEEGLFRSRPILDDNFTSLPNSTAEFRYDPQTNQLGYTVYLADFQPEQIEAIQVQSGRLAADGSSVYKLNVPDNWIDAALPITGVVTLSHLEEPYLISNSLQLLITTTRADALSLSSQLVATPAVLHVPVYVAPSPASDMHAAKSILTIGKEEDDQQMLPLVGHDLVADDPPVGYTSLVSGFELQYSSLGSLTNTDSSFADIQHVGITDNLSVVQSGRVDEATIFFGITAYGDWSTPNQVAFDIYIDTDDDGLFDYRLFNADAQGYFGSQQVSDSFVAVVEDLRTGRYSKLKLLNERPSNEVDTRLFNTNILILPVDAVDIGLSNADPNFAYQIQSADRVSGAFVDSTPLLRYDLTRKVIELFSLNDETGPIFDDHDGAVIGLQFESDNVPASGDSPNLLLLHHHNRSGDRAEIITVRYEWPSTSYLPIIQAQE